MQKPPQLFDESVTEASRQSIGQAPGRWTELASSSLVRVSKSGHGWAASIYHAWVLELTLKRHVLGVYPTPEAAVEAAKMLLSIEGDERLCTPRDIDAVRRELAKGPR